MRASILLIVVALAGCGEPRREVTVEVETDRDTIGPVSTTRSVETKAEIDADTAEALKRELNENHDKQP